METPWLDGGLAEPPLDYVPPPPANGRERLNRLRLMRSRRVGPATYRRLMAEHGDAARALAALPGIARAAGAQDYVPCPEGVANAEMKAASRLGARLICQGDTDYPALLAEISDAPPVFWAHGDQTLLSRPSIAIVGTRNASALGARMARRLARELGEAGFVVVSGLARGIDALAHEASLETGTIAVQAGGLDILYPPENADLAGRIGANGLRVSEMAFGLQPQGRHFPRRNRIVSGLARAVIVVEAAARSGSLITARSAADQGRDVMAVPGHPLDSRASGSNILIRDGATLVRSAEDVIEAIGPAVGPETPHADRPMARQHSAETGAPAEAFVPTSGPPSAPQAVTGPGGLEGLILSRLSTTPTDEDHLIRETGHSPRDVARALATLEMAGRIERSRGGRVALSV